MAVSDSQWLYMACGGSWWLTVALWWLSVVLGGSRCTWLWLYMALTVSGFRSKWLLVAYGGSQWLRVTVSGVWWHDFQWLSVAVWL